MSGHWKYEYTAVMNLPWTPVQQLEDGSSAPAYRQVDSWVGSVRRVCCHEPTGLVANLASTRALEPDVRRNILDLSQQEQQDLIDAMLALKKDFTNNADPEGKKRGLSVYDQFSYDHWKNSPSAHAGPAFFPWHRQFLLNFQSALRKVSGKHIVLPYWDWSDPLTRMDIWTPSLMGGNGTGPQSLVSDGPFSTNWKVVYNGSLVDKGLARAWGTPLGDMGHSMAGQIPNFGAMAADPVLPERDELLRAVALDVYDTAPWSDASHDPPSFRNTFEGWEKVGCHLHNSVHLWVGGEMRLVAISPNDPVFWLHHTMVDRVYAAWQSKHVKLPDYGYPAAGARQGHNLNDKMTPFTVTPKQVLSVAALGYTYKAEQWLEGEANVN